MAGSHGKSASRSTSGARKGRKAGAGDRSGATRSAPAKRGNVPTGATGYARDAATEWGRAIRYAAAALRGSDGPSLKDRLDSVKAGRGGRAADAADRLLSTLRRPGMLAAKLGAGNPRGERLRGSSSADEEATDTSTHGQGEWDDGLPLPVQQAMEVAVPANTAYELCLRFADYPEFIERVQDVEEIEEGVVALRTKVRGANRRIQIEIADARPGRRIDWEGSGDLPHSGVISFHELAPSLTHIELSIDFEPHGVLQRIARAVHVTDRVVRADMQRFKAYAELWQEESEDEPRDESGPEHENTDDETEIEDDDEFVDEEPDSDEDVEYEEEPEPAPAG